MAIERVQGYTLCHLRTILSVGRGTLFAPTIDYPMGTKRVGVY